MKDETIRAVLAIMVVGVFMLLTAFISLFPLWSDKAVEFSSYSDYFSKTSSVYTGIVGVIIGYYFGKETKIKNKPSREQSASQEIGEKPQQENT